jgi:fermentation-respiration switch protein FrsA (DUF1100 family)
VIPALELAQLCQQIYQTDQGWDHYWTHDAVVVAHKRTDAGDVIILRGSQTALDWARDFAAVPAHHGALGIVHAGFVIGMDDVYKEVQEAITGRPIICGHSLGAARAMLLAGLFVADRRDAAQVTVFGCPRPGGEQLRGMLVTSDTRLAAYRNESDPVTYVPIMPGIFCHVLEPTQIHGGAAPGDMSIFREHAITAYLAGLTG